MVMDAIKDLYISLRDEIKQNQEQENAICMFCYTACISMLAFAYSEKVEMVALLSQIAFIPFAFRVGRLRDSTAYISAYLKTKLEPQMSISWETEHNKYRQKFNYSKSLLVFITRCDFLILSIISLASFWIIYLNKSLLLITAEEYNTCKCSCCGIPESIDYNFGCLLAVIIVQLTCLGIMIGYTICYSNVDRMKEKKIKNWGSISVLNNKSIPCQKVRVVKRIKKAKKRQSVGKLEGR